MVGRLRPGSILPSGSGVQAFPGGGPRVGASDLPPREGLGRRWPHAVNGGDPVPTAPQAERDVETALRAEPGVRADPTGAAPVGARPLPPPDPAGAAPES